MDQRFRRTDERLGRGELANIFRGEETTGAQREVAICELPSDLGEDRMIEVRQIYSRWMSASAHAFVLSILEMDLDHSPPLMILEKVDGPTLRDIIRDKPLPLRSASRLLENLLDGLREIHQQGLVHGDLCPENILLSLGQHKIFPKVWRSKTANQNYSAPEVVVTSSIGTSSDIYSLGLIAYELLMGSNAFRMRLNEFIRRTQGGASGDGGAARSAWLAWHSSPESLPPPHHWVPTIPDGLSRVVHNMVRHNARDRLQSCQEILQRLQSLDRSSWPKGGAMPPPALEPEASKAGSIFAQTWVMVTLGVLILVAALFYFIIRGPDEVEFRILALEEGVQVYVGESRDGKDPIASTLRRDDEYLATVRVRPGTPLIFWKEGREEMRVKASSLALRDPIALKVGTERKELAFKDFDDRNFTAALNPLKELYELAPGDLEIGLALAQCHYQLNNYGASIEILLKLEKENRGEASIPYYLGLNALSQGKEGEAIRYLERAKALGGPLDACFFLGTIHLKQRALDEALERFDEYLRADPEGEWADRAKKAVVNIRQAMGASANQSR